MGGIEAWKDISTYKVVSLLKILQNNLTHATLRLKVNVFILWRGFRLAQLHTARQLKSRMMC